MSATRPVYDQREEILAILGTAMDRVRAWKGPTDAQLVAAAEAEVTTMKRRLANCEEALKQKVMSLTEAEKGYAELRKALAAKEAELVHQEVVEERRRGTDTNYLRRRLRTAEEDIRSLLSRTRRARMSTRLKTVTDTPSKNEHKIEEAEVNTEFRNSCCSP
jgi:vancomycin resistance protein YoaR